MPSERRIPFLDMTAPYRELRQDLDEAVGRVLSGGWYLLGEELAAFEREFASYVGTEHCVGVANGLDALTLALRAANIGPGDEVIVPSNTYIATWLAVSNVGATIVPVEPRVDTYTIDSEGVKSALTEKTRAVIPVHLYGLAADAPGIVAACAGRDVFVLEDAAQAHGATHRGLRAGNLGHAAAWSFYPAKNLGAFGDAGAVTTNDSAVADKIRALRNYGSRTKYVNDTRGVNSRLDEVQAAALRVKLRSLDAWNARRAAAAALYGEWLRNADLVLPVVPDNATSVWHVYPVRVTRRDQVRATLAAKGIDTLIHYPIPPHLQDAYADLNMPAGTFPISERIHANILSLPIGPHISDEDIAYVAEAVLAAVA